MRTITITSEDIKDLIIKKGEIVTRGREITKQKEELDTELNKCGLQVNKINDKLIPLVNGYGIELGEFEQIESVKLEGEELVVSIFDQVEEYKEAILEAKKKKAEEEANTSTKKLESINMESEKPVLSPYNSN